jgi:hypothetical protein
MKSTFVLIPGASPGAGMPADPQAWRHSSSAEHAECQAQLRHGPVEAAPEQPADEDQRAQG